MNKFLYGVLDLMKTKCKIDILLGDMNISRLMTHARQVEGDKLREQANKNKKARSGNYDYLQQKSGGINCSHGEQNFLSPAPRQLVSHPLRTGMIRRLGHQALGLREVFQASRHTPQALSVVRII